MLLPLSLSGTPVRARSTPGQKAWDEEEDVGHHQRQARFHLRATFRALARRWKDETRFMSSTTDIAAHPAYRQIIGMGYDALPLIFEDLRNEPNHWFRALKAITGENPIPAEARGKVPKMTQAWLSWANQHGF